jgi:hypothetical protein
MERSSRCGEPQNCGELSKPSFHDLLLKLHLPHSSLCTPEKKKRNNLNEAEKRAIG